MHPLLDYAGRQRRDTLTRPFSVLAANGATCSAASAQSVSYAQLLAAEGLPNLKVLSTHQFLVLATPHSSKSCVNTAGYCKADCFSGFLSFQALNL